ncbi:hypothetical protein HII31_12713 [Pseudocercospora fuligena]|uniref:Uncharacterized protein n=1 Tax=Pseudocercospora fuligena TaxID=685502 RepID=A0A8H6VGA5_9PEZI|nr:hypothetical protein HII31_12713 [Pseudocercospora fuligena]
MSGMTKRQQLRLDLHEQKDELDRAMSLLNHLQKGTDQEATEMLARLRIGQSIESEYQRIQAPHADGYGSNRSLSSSYSQGPSDPMDDDLSRQNRRLLSLLTPQMHAHRCSNDGNDRRSNPSSASNSISHAVHDWMSAGDGNMTWASEDFANTDPQTLESTTRHPVSDHESPQNYYTHQQWSER